MGRPPLREQDAAIIAAYRAWNPEDGGSVDELAARLGTTRATLYNVLHRNDEPLKTRRRKAGPEERTVPDPTVDYLLQKLIAAESELALIRAENEKLQAWVLEFAAKLDAAGIQHNHVVGGGGS